MTVRSLKASFLFFTLVSLGLYLAGRPAGAWSFAIGSFLSLFSLTSLMAAIPLLARPTSSPGMVKGVLALLLYLKLPLFSAGLYVGTRLPGCDQILLGVGVALVPLVLTVQAVCDALREGAREAREAEAQKARALALMEPQIALEAARKPVPTRKVYETGA